MRTGYERASRKLGSEFEAAFFGGVPAGYAVYSRPMATAGLKRLELEDRISCSLDPAAFLPACGQGALALQIRDDDTRTANLIEPLDDAGTRITGYSTKGSWLRVETPEGRSGWIHLSLVSRT